MKDERMLILSMVQEGKITADEAASLLEALGGPWGGDGDGGDGDWAEPAFSDEGDGDGPGGGEGWPGGRRGPRGRGPGRGPGRGSGRGGRYGRGRYGGWGGHGSEGDHDGGIQVDLGAVWDDAINLLAKARAKVESAVERTRRRMDEAGRKARQAGDKVMEAGDEALKAGEKAMDSFSEETVDDARDFFADVERGLAKVASELPEALSRFARFEFGPGARKEVAWHYDGAFEADGPIHVTVVSGDGPVKVEATDGDEYRVDIKNKVRAEDEEEAALIAKAATRWELFDNGFRLVVGEGRDVTADVTVKLPRNKTYALDLQTADGSLRVQDVHATEVRANSADGSVRIVGVRADGIHATTANGSIRLEHVVADKVTTATADGSVRVSGDVGQLNATSSDGSVRAAYEWPTGPDGHEGPVRDGHDDQDRGDAGVEPEDVRRRERIHWDIRTSDGSVRVSVPTDDDIGYELDLSAADGTVRVHLPNVEQTAPGTDRRGVHVFSPGFEEKATRFTVRARSADGSVVIRPTGEDGR